ncbi:MAG: ABC transporter substrate-binding protein [Chloroflexi bacterium]|nr:ABC transporter substrate-binding protein [Chloroflexota bacterium]
MYSFLYSIQGEIGSEEVVLNNLATKLEQPDELTFIFTIRPGVKYHPNEPIAGLEVTPEDIKATFQRRTTSLTAIDKRFIRLIDFAKTEVMPGRIFKLVTKRPFVPAIPELGWGANWGVLPASIVDQFPGSGLSDKEFGSGPFMLDSYNGAELISLKRHPEFFVPDRPLLDGWQWIVIQDSSSLLAAFRSGAHDVNGAVLDKRLAGDLHDDRDIRVFRYPNLFYEVIHLNVSRPPFNDRRVREAVDLAINRDEIMERIRLGEGLYNGPIQWAQKKWSLPQDELRQLMPYNPELAKQRLKEAGFDQLKVTMHLPSLPGPSILGDLASLIQQQLTAANIIVELKALELGAYITTILLPGSFEMTFFPNLPYIEPDRPLSFYHSKGVTGDTNWTGLNRASAAAQQAGFSPEVDELIDEQQREFNEERRRLLILDVQRTIIKEHGPQITLTEGYSYAAMRDYVKVVSPLTPTDGINSAVIGPLSPFRWDMWLDRS